MSRTVVMAARDVDELAELVAVAAQPPAARLGAGLRLEQLERAVRGEVELVAASASAATTLRQARG